MTSPVCVCVPTAARTSFDYNNGKLDECGQDVSACCALKSNNPAISPAEEESRLFLLKNHKFASWNLQPKEFPISDAKLADLHKQCFKRHSFGGHPKQFYQNMTLFLDIGTAKFYKAIRKSDKQTVTIKKIRNRSDTYEQAFVEGEAILSILSTFGPNMMTYFDAHSTKKNTWLVMEFIEGCTLKELSTIVEFQESHIAYIARNVLEAICWLHERGRAHRDIKGHNVMLRKDLSIVLMDFGFAIQHTAEKPSDNTSVGSLLYMAPEVARGEDYKYKPDIWGFGVMVYELLCGDVPLAHCTGVKETVTCLVNSDAPRIPAYNPCSELARDFVHQCLTLDPTRRPSASTLLHHPFISTHTNTNTQAAAVSRCTYTEFYSHVTSQLPSWPDVYEDDNNDGDTNNNINNINSKASNDNINFNEGSDLDVDDAVEVVGTDE
eukprot:c12044_g1_i1.p1 GENE.c12044_g1_i1~~c12044_g1_i1.p1  ORF type:complete len:479 (-),score=126.54 c12044_g1_i1:313-1620(-)